MIRGAVATPNVFLGRSVFYFAFWCAKLPLPRAGLRDIANVLLTKAHLSLSNFAVEIRRGRDFHPGVLFMANML
jgi:hypothetical protein